MRFKNNDSLSLSCIARKNKATKAFVDSLCFFLSRLLVNFFSFDFFFFGWTVLGQQRERREREQTTTHKKNQPQKK